MSDRSSAEVEQEIIAKRQAVEDTLEALRAKFSTGQLLNSVARSFTSGGGQGGEVMANLARQVRDNPLPLALAGASLAWLLIGQGVRRDADEPHAAAADPLAHPEPAAAEPTLYDRARYAADVATHGADHAVNALVAGHYDLSDIEPTAGKILDDARIAADEAAHGAAYVLEKLKAGAYRLVPAASRAIYDRARVAHAAEHHGADHVDEVLASESEALAADSAETPPRQAETAGRGAAFAGNARDAGRRVQETLDETIAAQPMLSAVVGVACGVILGAMLPAVTRRGGSDGDDRAP